MYHLHNILSSIIYKALHQESAEDSYAQWCVFYNGLSDSARTRVEKLNTILIDAIDQNNQSILPLQIMHNCNLLCFSHLSPQEVEKFAEYFRTLYNMMDLKSYGRQKIETLLLDQDECHIETAHNAIKHYVSCALGSLTIAQLVVVYNNFISVGEYKQEWQSGLLQELYYVIRQQLVSTRITNEDITSFRQLELYNSVQQRVYNTKLSLACSRFNVQNNQCMWSDFFYKVAKAYNKYKGLLTYLEIRNSTVFEKFCADLEEKMIEHKLTIDQEIDECNLSHTQIERIERILNEDIPNVASASYSVKLIIARHILGKATTELHLLMKNNHLQATSQHRIELHQYYQGFDAFQKQQLTREFHELLKLTTRLITQPHLPSRVINKIIIRKLSRAYYPDELYNTSQIEHAVRDIRTILSAIDFSQFFAGMLLRGKLVNKFISKILHSPRPFHTKSEFIESIIVSMVNILGKTQLDALMQNMPTMQERLRDVCRREVMQKLKSQTNWFQFVTSRVNSDKRKEYRYAKKLQNKLLVES